MNDQQENANIEVAQKGTEASPPGGVLVVDDGGILVTGDQEFVSKYVDRLKAIASDAVSVADLSGKNVADIAAIGGAAAALHAGAAAGEFVRISQRSMDLIRNQNLIPGDPGYYLSTVRDGAGKFSGQIQWSPVSMLPAQALALQMAMVTISLRTAIASVEQAVERVQDSVDAILELAKADLAGGVLGVHDNLDRHVAHLDETGKLSTADWESIAALGPALEVTGSKLRQHIRGILDTFDQEASIGDRADQLEKAVRQGMLGESLQLLVIAEDSLYKWHSLKIARLEATEPEHLDAAVRAMTGLLNAHLAEDGALLASAAGILDRYSTIKPLEIVRWMSASSVRENVALLRKDLDEFVEARRTAVLEWQEREDPTIGDAFEELGNRAKGVGVAIGGAAGAIGGKALDVGAAGLGQVGAGLMRVAERRRKEPVGAAETVDQT
ncbi:hypothetical protein ACWF62_14310 [Rhodococcus sp. NPDC054953]